MQWEYLMEFNGNNGILAHGLPENPVFRSFSSMMFPALKSDFPANHV
jgi:hypothetical protein